MSKYKILGCCAEGLFRCQSNKFPLCLFNELLCNGREDCLDGEDEDPSMCDSRK